MKFLTTLLVLFLFTGCEYIKDYDEALKAASGKSNDLEAVKRLVSQTQQSTNSLNEALRSASEYGNLEIVKYLVSQGATDFSEALVVASSKQNTEVIVYLAPLVSDSK